MAEMRHEEMNIDWGEAAKALTQFLKMKTSPIGIKFCRTREEMEAIPKIRRPKEGAQMMVCQLIGQAARLNFTVGFTKENGIQGAPECASIWGLMDEGVMKESSHFNGVWFDTDEAAVDHQHKLTFLGHKYEALAFSPLASKRFEPDVCAFYGTPEQMMFVMCALQFKKHELMEMTFVGESACSDSFVKAMATGKPCLSVPCYGERRYGGAQESDMVCALPPAYMPVLLEGLACLNKNGLRYPIAYYGMDRDISEGLGKSYDFAKKS